MTPIYADDDVFFVSLNDTLLLLKDSTIPVWWNGDLYAPITILNSHETGISVGANATYNEYTREVTISGENKGLVFQMDKNSCYNYKTGEVYDISAVNLNGRIYIPIYVVCNFFGLNINLYYTDYGRLLRITNGSFVLPGNLFIDGADWMMSSRLKEYNQSKLPPPEPPEVEEPEVPVVEVDIPLYYGVRCDGGEATMQIYDALGVKNTKAVFFLSPTQIGDDGNLVRTLLSNGHSIGILAEGEDENETTQLLQDGLEQLARVAYTSTTIALVPPEQQEAFAEDGWVCWRETASLIVPEEDETDAYRYATAIIRALQRLEDGVYVTLDNGEDLAEIFSASMLQLEGRTFIAAVPLETKL